MSKERHEIAFYDEEIPSFVECELDRLYGVSYCSLRHLRLYGKLEKAQTYVCQAEGNPVAIILFRVEEQAVSVLNEVIDFSDVEIRRFTDNVFLRYPQIRTVTFPAIEKRERHLSRPCQRQVYHSHVWLSVPDTAEAYMNTLGPNTRQVIRRYLRKLRSSFPSFECRFIDKEAVSEHDIRTILGFNQERLKSKGTISSADETEIQRIIALTRECGMVCVATIDGRVCAGTINYRFGENFAFRATGYDQAYDNYRLGFLVNFLTYCECIERNAKNIHLGWGTQDYKFRLGGVQHDLEHLIVFRSRAHFFLAWRTALQVAIKDKTIKTRRYIKDAATRHEGPAASLAKAVVTSVRWLRH